MALSLYSRSAWWMSENKDKSADMLVELVRTQRRYQQQRYLTMRRYISVYEYGYKSSDRLSTKDRYLDDTVLTFNAAQNAIDTIVSKVAVPNVWPMAVTEGGTWSQRDRAEKLTHCLQGQLDEFDYDRMLKGDMIRDFAVTGMGAVKVIPDYERGEIRAERVLPLDLLFDEAESRYGRPRCMYHTFVMDRHVVCDIYGQPDDDLYGSARNRREKILKAQDPKPDEWDLEINPNLIEVFEAWHLPSRAPSPSDPEDKGSEDGVHIICVDGAILLYEEWKWDRFPFAFYRAKRSRVGMWGMPMMRQLAPGQREFERIMTKLQKAHQRMGGAHILANRAAKIAPRSLTNDVGTVVEWEGSIAPQEWTPGAASPQTYQWVQMLPDYMLRFAGISQFSANAAVPAGLQNASGKALQLFADEENKGLVEWHRELEHATLDLSDLIIRTARDMVDRGYEVKARYKAAKDFEYISWKEALLDIEDYTLRIYPVNALSQTPAAKLQQASELLQMEAITKEDWRKLSGIPDIQAQNELDLSDSEIIDKNLDYMVRTGKYTQPEPFDNLAMIVLRAGKFYNLCRVRGVADARLQLIRQYAADAKALIDRESAQAAPQMPPGGPMPGPEGAPLPPQGGGGPPGGTELPMNPPTMDIPPPVTMAA